MMAVHRVANPHLDAAVPEGLAAAVDLAEVERGDGIIEGHCCLLAQVFPAQGKVKARPASVSRIRNREEPSKTSQRSATARYIADSADASSIFKRRATSCNRTGCTPSTDIRATSATIRRARRSL